MKRFLFFAAIALLVFLCGLGAVLFHRMPAKKTAAKSVPAVQTTRPASAPRGLPPLRLPPGVTAERCAENSWEYSGEIAANFVLARARLNSWFQNQSWRPERRITLDESLSPKVILTFSGNEYELTLMVWKINTDLTGFSYRRDKKNEPTGGLAE